jgi:hypothetical protein
MRVILKKCKFIAFAILLSLTVLSNLSLSQESKRETKSNKEELIGSWKLVSVEDSSSNKRTYPLGKKPVGYLVYDDTNHMSLQVMSSDRPAMAIRAATRQELEEIIFSFDAYSGTYSIDQDGSTIIYHIESSIYPTVVGTELKRKFKLIDDNLTILSTYIDKSDGLERTRLTVWKKLTNKQNTSQK